MSVEKDLPPIVGSPTAAPLRAAPLPPPAVERAISFAMAAAGFPRDGGPIAAMPMDHEAGRAHVSLVAANAEQASRVGPERAAFEARQTAGGIP